MKILSIDYTGEDFLMRYAVKQITGRSEIESCNLFRIDQYNWGGNYRPNTYGW